jgi:hypothetical protein
VKGRGYRAYWMFGRGRVLSVRVCRQRARSYRRSKGRTPRGGRVA